MKMVPFIIWTTGKSMGRHNYGNLFLQWNRTKIGFHYVSSSHNDWPLHGIDLVFHYYGIPAIPNDPLKKTFVKLQTYY